MEWEVSNNEFILNKLLNGWRNNIDTMLVQVDTSWSKLMPQLKNVEVDLETRYLLHTKLKGGPFLAHFRKLYSTEGYLTPEKCEVLLNFATAEM